MSRAKGAESKKKTRVAAGPQAAGFARSLRESVGGLLWRALPLILIVTFLGGTSALLWWPVHAQEQSARNERLTAAAIRSALLRQTRPPWISKEDFEQTANLGLCAQDQSIFSPNLSHRLAQAYEASPWVERVNKIGVRYPAQLEVDLLWRRPVACVERTTMVLDRHGVVLNLMADNPLLRGLPRLSGVACVRTDAGQRVPEKDMLDALALLGIVRDALSLSPGNLHAILVQREGAGTWRICTDTGPVIYWGAFGPEPVMDEPRTTEKVTLLQRRLRESGDPTLLEYVKVYVAQAPVKLRTAGAVAENAAPAPASAPNSAHARATHDPH